MNQCFCGALCLYVLLNIFFVYAQDDSYCYSNDNEKKQSSHYSTKTAYEVARGTEKRYFNVPKCEATKFWLISRHGTRNPSAKSINQLRNLVGVRDEILENFKRFDRDRHPNQLCSEDLEQLKNWRFDNNLTAQYENFLTIQGWNDLKYLALDYQRTFQNVLEPRYSREKYKFGFTKSQRTEASYKAFVEGLFGENAYQIIETLPEGNNSILLKPYEKCPQWQTQEESAEVYKFQQTDIYKQTLVEISARLGYKYTLNGNQIDSMWDMCRYDLAWYLLSGSPWCAAFTVENVNVLEYLQDLKDYYKAGAGNELNKNIMCAAVQDMLKHLQGENSNPKSIAYFSHADALQLFLTSLKYGKDDEKLRADNYQKMKYRKFRTSVLSPFASNLAVIKYDCPNERERQKVQFFLNERLIEFDYCNVGLCDLSKILDEYKHFLDVDCSSLFCGGNYAVKIQIPLPVLIFFTFFKIILL